MFFRQKRLEDRTYLQIVESCREGGQVRQRVVATLGRAEDRTASGKLDQTAAVERPEERGVAGAVGVSGGRRALGRQPPDRRCPGLRSALARDRVSRGHRGSP